MQDSYLKYYVIKWICLLSLYIIDHNIVPYYLLLVITVLCLYLSIWCMYSIQYTYYSILSSGGWFLLFKNLCNGCSICCLCALYICCCWPTTRIQIKKIEWPWSGLRGLRDADWKEKQTGIISSINLGGCWCRIIYRAVFGTLVSRTIKWSRKMQLLCTKESRFYAI